MFRNRSSVAVFVALFAAVGLVGVVYFTTRGSGPRTLLIGDSLMAQTAPYVERAASGSVKSDAIAGTGLLSRDQFDWITASAHLAKAEHPDVVVVLFVGNCREPSGLDPTQPVGCDTPGFFAQWRAAADQITTIFERRGARVFWVIPPPMREATYQSRTTLLTADYLSLARTHHDIGYVDARRALGTSSGAYLSAARGPDGQVEPLRAPDGVHLAKLGAQRLAAAIVATTRLA